MRPSLPSGIRVFGIVSDSMRPTLAAGEAVLVEPCATRNLRAGDLVVVRRPGGPVCHRFLRCSAGLLHTQGDNRWRADAPTPEEALIGKVISVLSARGKGRSVSGPRARLTGLARLLGRRLKWQADRLARKR